MKRVLIGIICMLATNGIHSQQTSTKELSSLKNEVASLQSSQNRIKNDIINLTEKSKKSGSRINSLESENKKLLVKLDSLQNAYNDLANSQKNDKSELTTAIVQTNNKVQATEDILSSRSVWGFAGIVVLLIALIATVWAFLKKFKSGSSSIDDVRKAQSSLETAQEKMRKAQEKMQEEAIQLDNKLIEILSNQPVATPTTAPDGELDHSLALKVADEIVRIETNLSRMDSSIKGYKQLSKAVERIRNNFSANGYEISDMLNKPYNAGMKCIADFVPNESLEPGQQIITGIIKPQVLFKGVMIQAAQITVSQNI